MTVAQRLPRFVNLPDPALTFREEGLVVEKADASGLRVAYLSRQLLVGEEVVLAVEKVRNKRRTFSIAFGATTCSKKRIKSLPQHRTTCCRPQSCPQKGNSVVSFIGLPFQGKKQTFPSVHTTVSLIRRTADVIVIVDDTRLPLSDPDRILSSHESVQFIVLTDDVKSIRLSANKLSAAPEVTPLPPSSASQQVKKKKVTKSESKAQAAAGGEVNKGPDMVPDSKAAKKKNKNKKSVKENEPPAAKAVTTTGESHGMEIDPDLVHPKWGPTKLKKKEQIKAKAKAPAAAEAAQPKSAKAAIDQKPKKAGNETASKPFAFLKTPYSNDNVIITDLKQVTRVNPDGFNIVYFNRNMGNDTLSLRVESFSEPEAVNMTFGITTCTVAAISAHKFHVKSFCTNDGRPCGGRSLTCKLDRKVRGAMIISFKKVPEGVNFLSDGFLVHQFKDKESIFKHKQAFPFIALTGDVESVRIVDPAESGPLPPLSKRSRKDSVLSTLSTGAESPLTVVEKKVPVVSHPPPGLGAMAAKAVAKGDSVSDHKDPDDSGLFEEIQSKKKKKPTAVNEDRFTFVRLPYTDNIEIKEKNRLVVRKTYSPEQLNAVYFSRELSTDRRLAIQVERLSSTIPTTNCFNIGITTCDPDTVKRFDCHGYRTCWVKSECGGLSTSFSIFKCKNNSQPGTIVTLERRDSSVLVGAGDWFRTQLTDNMSLFKDRSVYPFIVLNGSVSSIKIIEDPERFSAPLPVIPRPLVPVTNQNGDGAPIPVPAVAPVISQFVVPALALSNMQLTNNKRTVTRVDVKGSRIVFLNHPLEIGQEFAMRVEKSDVVHVSSCSFMLGLTTCNLSSMEKIRQHGAVTCADGSCGGQSLMRTISNFADAGTIVRVERKPVSIIVTLSKGSEERGVAIDMGKVPNVRYFYPYLLLSGNAVSVRLVDKRHSLVMPQKPEAAEPLAPADISPSDPSPSFERDPRCDVMPAFATRIRQSLESPPISPTPSEAGASLSPFVMEPKPNYPGVNGYPESLMSYDLENCEDCNTPTDWDQSSDSNEYPVSSPVLKSLSGPPAPAPVPRKQTAFPFFKAVPAAKVSNQLAPCRTPTPVPRVNANRTASLFIPRKWYSNANVRHFDDMITRLRSPSGRNYIFSNEMRVNEKITFKVSEVEEHLFDGSLLFGLTTTPILQIDFSSLPADARQWNVHPDHNIRWFTSHNLYNTVGICDGLTLIRRDSGIFLSLDSDEDGAVEIIPNISASGVVYPFFLMSGCVRSLQLDTAVGPLPFPDQVRLYLIFFYLTMLNRFALHKY